MTEGVVVVLEPVEVEEHERVRAGRRGRRPRGREEQRARFGRPVSLSVSASRRALRRSAKFSASMSTARPMPASSAAAASTTVQRCRAERGVHERHDRGHAGDQGQRAHRPADARTAGARGAMPRGERDRRDRGGPQVVEPAAGLRTRRWTPGRRRTCRRARTSRVRRRAATRSGRGARRWPRTRPAPSRAAAGRRRDRRASSRRPPCCLRWRRARASKTVPAASAASVRPASTPSIVSHAGNGRIRSRISSASAVYSARYMPR